MAAKPKKSEQKPIYNPTAKQIAIACQRILCKLSEEALLQRSGRKRATWSVPVVRDNSSMNMI